ncbi:hypothetical protein [Helicobacter mehlei]|uniref:hypothetical protein n=1 Tax=Helicobacter mehlei TaxID=2316080 RepID=UPI0013CE0A84|nr:hypothetical protein [Helicobacter mehlei]
MDLTEQELVQLKTIDNDLVASGGGNEEERLRKGSQYMSVAQIVDNPIQAQHKRAL